VEAHGGGEGRGEDGEEEGEEEEAFAGEGAPCEDAGGGEGDGDGNDCDDGGDGGAEKESVEYAGFVGQDVAPGGEIPGGGREGGPVPVAGEGEDGEEADRD